MASIMDMLLECPHVAAETAERAAASWEALLERSETDPTDLRALGLYDPDNTDRDWEKVSVEAWALSHEQNLPQHKWKDRPHVIVGGLFVAIYVEEVDAWAVREPHEHDFDQLDERAWALVQEMNNA